jgi:sucrose-phosphate synthase
MMRGNTLAVVVKNRHGEELSVLPEEDQIYFARSSFAAGIMEAIDYYDFFGAGSASRTRPESGGEYAGDA